MWGTRENGTLAAALALALSCGGETRGGESDASIGGSGGLGGAAGESTGGYDTGGYGAGGYDTGGYGAGGYGAGGYGTGGYNAGGYGTGGYGTGGISGMPGTGGYNTGGYNTGGYNTGGSSTGGIGGAVLLGRACAMDAECGSGLVFCAKATSSAFGGQGPPKGYCTASCASDPSLCKKVHPSAVCKSFGSGIAYCFEGCSFGPDSLQSFDPKKCHGRQEVACSPYYTGTALTPACLPRCNSDADCGGALLCHPATGLCSPTLPIGKSIGEPCSPTATNECRGFCQTLSHPSGQEFTSICTEGCTIGGMPACGWGGPGTGKAGAACLFVEKEVAANGGIGLGDLGQCGQLCSCNAQCKNAALVCRKWSGANGAQLAQAFGQTGYCADPLAGDAGTDPGIPVCP